MSQRVVYLVDEDVRARRSLAFELGGLGIDAWPFAGGGAFLAEVPRLRPACILIDTDMAGNGAADVIAWMMEAGLHWPIIALSAQHDLSTAVEAMKKGAIDFLEKPVGAAALRAALERAFQLLDEWVEAEEAREEAAERIRSLTAREFDVSRALFSGSPNKAIAHRLGISVRTVEKHRANIMAKLGVRSLAEAVVIAAEAGLELPAPLLRGRTGRPRTVLISAVGAQAVAAREVSFP